MKKDGTKFWLELTGLTPGQAYYVQVNGTLGLAPDTPRVFAGVAASATKLLIGKEGSASTVQPWSVANCLISSTEAVVILKSIL